MPGIKTIASVYGGAFLIGLALVSFPASSSFLKEAHHLSDQQYGSIFLPQLVFAIVGALAGGNAVRRLSLKTMYLLALASLALSQLFLLLSIYVPPGAALLFIMCGTACFGFGFGFGGGPLNGLASLLFVNQIGTALTTLHMMAGAGLMLGPLLVSASIATGSWPAAPASLFIFALLLWLLSRGTELPDQSISDRRASHSLPYRESYFQLLMLISVLYALSESAFSNWAVIFLNEGRNFSMTSSATALAAFWGGLTLGRLAVSFVVLRIQPRKVWVIFPALMSLAFLLLPRIETPAGGIAAFTLAGLACSAFFPLMVAVGSERYPHSVSWLASMLTAALMFGVGIGSYAVGALVERISLDKIYYLSALYPLAVLAVIIMLRGTRDRPQ